MFVSLTDRVVKATNPLLVGPDLNMNLGICNSMNTNLWLTKDMVKALKKRLKHRSPKVQILALTLLDTMMKNCGDYLHLQLSERNIINLLIKIIRKQMNTQVRDKILILIETWKEEYGGPKGKRPQYYWAYQQLRKAGVQFPERPRDSSTSPVKLLTEKEESESESEISRSSSSTQDETITSSSQKKDEPSASEVECLSLSDMDSIRSIMERLADMMQKMNPQDCETIRSDVVVNLVKQCYANQKKLDQFLSADGNRDSELLNHGLHLNDSLSNVISKHDAIACGRYVSIDVGSPSPRATEVRRASPIIDEVRDLSPRTNELRNSSPRTTEVRNLSPITTEVRNWGSTTAEIIDLSPRQTEVKESCPKSNATQTTPVVTQPEEEGEEFDLMQLVPRSTRSKPIVSESTSTGIREAPSLLEHSNNMAQTTSIGTTAAASTNPFNALVLSNTPPPVKTAKKEEDMIDLLSITLSTNTISPNSTLIPPSPYGHNLQHLPMSPTMSPTLNGYSYTSQPYLDNQAQIAYNEYVTPWVHTQFHPQSQPPPQFSCPQTPQPWAAAQVTGGQISLAMGAPYTPMIHQVNASYMPVPSAQQNYSIVPSNGNNGSATYGEEQAMLFMRNPNPAIPQKQFVPSYRLFEDLNVLGSAERRLKTNNNGSPCMLGMSNQAMVSGLK